MKQSRAIEMISVPERSHSESEVWVDFGSGTGTFTLALAHILGKNSRIIAVDKDSGSLEKIPDHFDQVTIEKRNADFEKDEFPFSGLDGILMANSLHYIQNQEVFLEKAKPLLKSKGCFLVVEYDTNISNPWIPYPVSFARLNKLFKESGFLSIRKLKEESSRYNRANLYSAIIEP